MRMLRYLLPILLICSFFACGKKPEACFTVKGGSDEVGKEVTFISCSIAAQKYEWDFGDGIISTRSVPQITYKYKASGTYNVKLIISSKGRKDEAMRTIVVR